MLLKEKDKSFYSLKNFDVPKKEGNYNILGKGSFATVFLATHKISEKNFAIKSVK